MILPTMTLTELAKEIQSDYKEVHARWTKFNPKFNKMRLKQTYFHGYGIQRLLQRKIINGSSAFMHNLKRMLTL